MGDVFNKEQRSSIMKKVKSKGNSSTELKLASIFKEYSIKGWRRGYKAEGKPDFVFLKWKTAVFVDGCFWHGHDCRNLSPQDNQDYWREKITRNKNRDANVVRRLQEKGWQVLRIWECELKNKNRDKLLLKLAPLMKALTC